MTSTSSCLQSKIDSLKQQINVAKLNVAHCLSKDASNDILLEKNMLLTEKLQQYQKNDEMESTTTPYVLPIFSITFMYIILFFIIGMFYNVLLSQSILSLMHNQDFINHLDSSDSYETKWNNIRYCVNKYRCILFVVISILSFAINYGIMYALILKGSQHSKAIQVITLCIIAIIGVTFLMINNINFNKVFENTVGFFLVQCLSPKKNVSFSTFINSLFSHSIFPKGGIDFSFLLTMFRLDNFGDVLKDIGTKPNGKYDFYFHSLQLENLDLFTHMIVTKNTIGHMCWILFSTLACTFVSLKFLMKNL